jgi:uncharacterized membrane protein YecN with MAPEG domain
MIHQVTFTLNPYSFQVISVIRVREVAILEHNRGADKSLARPERKQSTATEYFDFHITYLFILSPEQFWVSSTGH